MDSTDNVVAQSLYGEYGVENIAWNDALARYYHACAMSDDNRWILYIGVSNCHAILDRGENLVYEEFGYHAWVRFSKLSGMPIETVNKMVELVQSGGNDPFFWQGTYVQAIYIGKSRIFSGGDEKQMALSPGDLVLGYVDGQNYFYCLSFAGIRLRDLRDIRQVSKVTVTEFNQKCGYQWDDSYQHFVRVKS